VVHGVGPEFKPQYHKTNKQTKNTLATEDGQVWGSHLKSQNLKQEDCKFKESSESLSQKKKKKGQVLGSCPVIPATTEAETGRIAV
jgi:hypothetical protein